MGGRRVIGWESPQVGGDGRLVCLSVEGRALVVLGRGKCNICCELSASTTDQDGGLASCDVGDSFQPLLRRLASSGTGFWSTEREGRSCSRILAHDARGSGGLKGC